MNTYIHTCRLTYIHAYTHTYQYIYTPQPQAVATSRCSLRTYYRQHTASGLNVPCGPKRFDSRVPNDQHDETRSRNSHMHMSNATLPTGLIRSCRARLQHTYTHTYMHIWAYKHTCMHTLTYKHKHTHIHVHCIHEHI